MASSIYVYGGVPMNPPATSFEEAERRYRAALQAGDARAIAFQKDRQRRAKAFSMAAMATRPAR
jgi:hypothetical protein